MIRQDGDNTEAEVVGYVAAAPEDERSCLLAGGGMMGAVDSHLFAHHISNLLLCIKDITAWESHEPVCITVLVPISHPGCQTGGSEPALG